MEAQPLKNLPTTNLAVDFNWECNSESNIPARTIRDTVLITYEKENEESKDEDMK